MDQKLTNLAPPPYNSIINTNIKITTDINFNSRMTIIFDKINRCISESMLKGVYECVIFLSYNNMSTQLKKKIHNSIKTKYSTKPYKFNHKMFNKNNKYKITISWY